MDEAWRTVSGASSAMQEIQERIKGYGESLFAWGVTKTHPDTEEIKKLQEKVELFNASAPIEENKAESLYVSKRLDDFLIKQEIYWHQCSRVFWLKHGDKNTKFFYSKASQRRCQNFIQGIRNQQ